MGRRHPSTEGWTWLHDLGQVLAHLCGTHLSGPSSELSDKGQACGPGPVSLGQPVSTAAEALDTQLREAPPASRAL